MPDALRAIVGKREVWRSLGTDSPTVALRRSHTIAANIEREFEAARLRVGLPVDETVLAGLGQQAGTIGRIVEPAFADIAAEVASGLTLGELYDAYMADPTRDWSPTTRMAYQTTRRVVVAAYLADVAGWAPSANHVARPIVASEIKRLMAGGFHERGHTLPTDVDETDNRTNLLVASNPSTGG